MQNITQLRACATVSQRKMANGVHKSQLEKCDTIRYDLPTLDGEMPQQIFVQPRGWRKPELKAVDAAAEFVLSGKKLLARSVHGGEGYMSNYRFDRLSYPVLCQQDLLSSLLFLAEAGKLGHDLPHVGERGGQDHAGGQQGGQCPGAA